MNPNYLRKAIVSLAIVEYYCFHALNHKSDML